MAEQIQKKLQGELEKYQQLQKGAGAAGRHQHHLQAAGPGVGAAGHGGRPRHRGQTPAVHHGRDQTLRAADAGDGEEVGAAEGAAGTAAARLPEGTKQGVTPPGPTLGGPDGRRPPPLPKKGPPGTTQ
ncbi:prefoldin subunit 6 isoform X3 [Gallus gallus]|uniref:prefoldin subunit 6 isoform X3 n=1 Tax=Gallus gallus TaxID=9031 RepID=UPI001F02767B|nr:prefoldin subunit 6 isoform X3 [Gallus gallus]